jgi:hypothetical protein
MNAVVADYGGGRNHVGMAQLTTVDREPNASFATDARLDSIARDRQRARGGPRGSTEL